MSHPQLSTRKHVSKHTYLVVSYMATGMCKRMAHYTHASLKATHVRTGVCFKQHDAVYRCLPVFRISEAPGWRQLSQQDTHAPLKATHVRECFLSNMMPQIAPVIRCLPVFRISEAPGWRLAVTTGPLKATHVRECFLSNMMPQIAPVIRCPPVFGISEIPVWSWVRTKSSCC